MVMTSHQIAGMASAQSNMFGGFVSYSQQITPPFGRAPGMGQGAPVGQPYGYVSGPPPAPPPPMGPGMPTGMPHQGSMMQMAMGLPMAYPGSGMQQAMGERMLGAGFGGMATMGNAIGTGVAMAPLVGMGLGALGVGGTTTAALGALGGPLGLAAGAAVGAGTFAAEQMYQGVNERRMVNQVLRRRFGTGVGVGGGRGGMGFSSREMGGVSTMMREMSADDMFTDMDELARVMDRTAQMGLYRGVQSARQFRQRFRKTVESLKEIAEIMQTSLEGATGFMETQRNLGFFTGNDIQRSLMQTRVAAGASGMSIQQMQQMQSMGTQMGRAMGMRGRVGAGAMREMGTNIAMGMQTGALSDEMIAEATGGLTGAEGAQALAGRMMQINRKWMSRGAGRVMLAAMWDPETGGMNREMMERMRRGDISFQEARSIGRRNIAKTGGRRSEFFRDEERLIGEAMEQGGGDMFMGMIEQHFGKKRGLDLDDPIMQRWMRRRFGMSQSEIEAFVEMRREWPRIQQQRRRKTIMQMENMARQRGREGRGLQGLRRRLINLWEKNVENPFRQAADDLVTSWSEGIERLTDDLEGRVMLKMSEEARGQMLELARTGRTPEALRGAGGRYAALQARAIGAERDPRREMIRGLGRALGTRAGSSASMLSAAGIDPAASPQAREEQLRQLTQDAVTSPAQMGFGSEEMGRLSKSASRMLLNSMSETGRRGHEKRMAEGGGADVDYRMNMLMQNAELKKAFLKAKTRGRQIALLRNLEERAFGEGSKYLSQGAMVGGVSTDLLEMTVEQAEKEQQEALQGLVEASEEGLTFGGRAGLIAGRLLDEGGPVSSIIKRVTGSKKVVGPTGGIGFVSVKGGGAAGALARMFGGGRVPVDIESAQRLMGSSRIRELTRAAAKGGPAGERALRELRKITGGGRAAEDADVQQRDLDELNTMVDMLAKGSDEAKDNMMKFLKASTDRDIVAIVQRTRKEGRSLQRWGQKRGDTLKRDIGEETYSSFMAIQEARQRGDFSGADQLERDFVARYGATEEGNILAARLTSAGQAGLGLQEALASMGEAEDILRRPESRRDRAVMERTLRDLGIRDQRDMRRILGRGFMNRMRQGKATAQELWERMGEDMHSKLAEAGLSEAQVMKHLKKIVKTGRAEGGGGTGFSKGEITDMFLDKAMVRAEKARQEGASDEAVSMDAKQYKELQNIGSYMKLMLQKQYSPGDLATAMKEAGIGTEGGGGPSDPPAGRRGGGGG